MCRQALAISRRAIGTKHLDYGVRMANHGRVLAALGRTEEARRQFEGAIDIFKETLPKDHPYLTYAKAELADL